MKAQSTDRSAEYPGSYYRPDIDGLRALAVLAVVAYHYTNDLPGGFIGVDIFFVISGYLITGLLAKAFETQSFGHSLLDFYERRVRRIFPALSLILALCLVVGWLALFPFEYQPLGKHVVAGAGFVENLLLWSEAGYFDAAAITKPLLHLWSLAVEEQFYIFWPLVLWVIIRRRLPLMSSIAVIAGVSFALNLWCVYNHHASAAFYLPLTRTWELMAGAWLAIGHRRNLSWLKHWLTVQSWLGLLLIVLGFLMVRADDKFPGFWALFPVVATVLIINAGPGSFLNRRLFSTRPMVWLGLISYPLYLWHWVLLSLTIVVFGPSYGWVEDVTDFSLFALSILLSWITWRGVEQPLRRRGDKTAVVLALLMAALGLAGLGVYAASGVPERSFNLYTKVGLSYTKTIKRSPRRDECFDLNTGTTLPKNWYCVLGDPDAMTWIMAYGDSHALSLIPALDLYGKETGRRVVFAGISGCLALQGIYTERSRGPACRALTKRAMHLVKSEDAAAVILIERWTYYFHGITNPDDLLRIRIDTPYADAGKAPIEGVKAFRHALKSTLAYYQSLGVLVVLLEDNPQQKNHLSSSFELRFNPDLTERELNSNAVTLSENERYQKQANQLLEDAAGVLPHFHGRL